MKNTTADIIVYHVSRDGKKLSIKWNTSDGKHEVVTKKQFAKLQENYQIATDFN